MVNHADALRMCVLNEEELLDRRLFGVERKDRAALLRVRSGEGDRGGGWIFSDV